MAESTAVVGSDSSLAVPSTSPTHPIEVDVSLPSLVGEGLVYLSTDELLVLDASKHRSPEYGLRGEALWRKWAELDGVPYSPRTRDNAPAGWAIGAVYARFSTPKQGSIRDQVRTCLEWAQNNRIHVVDDMVFVDWGLSGRSVARPQYQAMQEAARAKGYDVLLAFKTNRIGRSVNEAIRIAKNELVPLGIRVVFVANRIDTAGGKGWVRRLKIEAFLDDLGTDANADAIQAAHIGQLRRKEKYRATPFGYYGKIVDGTTRLGKPRRELTIDPNAAKVVCYIFKLRVEDRLQKKQIARRLTMESIKPPPGLKRWDNQNVHNILNREAYIGKWCYGRVETSLNPETGMRESRRRDEPLETVHHEDLRIISDVLFADAKRMQIERGRRSGGRPATRPKTKRMSSLLNGFLFCKHHNHRLYCNVHSHECPRCKELVPAEQTLFSKVHRQRAVAVVCDAVAELILQEQSVLTAAVDSFRAEFGSKDVVAPEKLTSLRRELALVTTRIFEILADRSIRMEDSRRVRQELEQQRANLESQLARLTAEAAAPRSVPDAQSVHTVLSGMAALLKKYGSSGDAAQTAAVREIVEIVTGGRIDVVQVGTRARFKGYPVGSFECDLAGLLAKQTGVRTELRSRTVICNFRIVPKHEPLAEEIKARYDRGQRFSEIAYELGVGEHLVQTALRWWHTSRGLTIPRFHRLPDAKRYREAGGYKRVPQITDEVGKLYEAGLQMKSIAAKLDTSLKTVRKALMKWCDAQGKTYPDLQPGRRRAVSPAVGSALPGQPPNGREALEVEAASNGSKR